MTLGGVNDQKLHMDIGQSRLRSDTRDFFSLREISHGRSGTALREIFFIIHLSDFSYLIYKNNTKM